MGRRGDRGGGGDLIYLDLSGYAFTGKAAVIDLLREVRGCAVPSMEFEFALLRCNDGILDLEHALVDDWSPIRSCEAVRRFRELIGVYGGSGSALDRLIRHGHHYDRSFPGFTTRSLSYVDALVDHTWRGEWSFAAHSQPVVEVIARKLAVKVRLREAARYDIYLAAPGRERFESATRTYLEDILSAAAAPGDDVVVMHNAFEPFDPTRSMRFLADARCIVIDRDPRDVWVSARTYVGSYGRRGWGAATGGSVETFIDRFRTLRSMVKHDRDDERVLRVHFESLVTRYDETVGRILTFMGKSAGDHLRPRQSFDPARSARGVGAWKHHEDQRAIALIADRLGEFCVDV